MIENKKPDVYSHFHFGEGRIRMNTVLNGPDGIIGFQIVGKGHEVGETVEISQEDKELAVYEEANLKFVFSNTESIEALICSLRELKTEMEGGQPEEENDLVNHPPHYKKHPSGVECIQISECFNFNLGNALKYIWRADEKGSPLTDLEKAAWYINREIERRKK